MTLAADDVLLDQLLARLTNVPLARALLTGASIYRIPVHEIGLTWQVSDKVDAQIDPDLQAAYAVVDRKIDEARDQGVTDTTEMGLTEKDAAVHEAYWTERRRPPLAVPDSFTTAATALRDLGLLAPTTTDAEQAFTIHRWTADAVLTGASADVKTARHRRAAAYWRWKVAIWPQDRLTDITQLLESGYHILTVGDLDAVDATIGTACRQLSTWGLWDWETRVCREVLAQVSPSSRPAATYMHQLGMLAQRRGNYSTAENHYRRAITIVEELGDRAGLAGGHHQLGFLAQERGDYTTAENHYRQSLTINEELGNLAGIAGTASELGGLRTAQGRVIEGLPFTLRALAVHVEIGSPDASTDLYWLGRQRDEVGESAFREILREHLADEDVEAVLGMMQEVRDDESEGEQP